MELNDYQTKALVTVLYPECYNQQYLKDGLVEEVGEVMGKFKRAVRDQNAPKENGEVILNPDQLHEIALEIGDVLWYLSVLAHRLGLTLEDIAEMNIEKLAKRKAEGKIQGKGDNR